PVLGTDLNRSESTPGRTAAVCPSPLPGYRGFTMTINAILPCSGMRARLPAPLPARITIVIHGARGETHGPAASAGPAAPIFGSIFLEKKKIDCAKISDVVSNSIDATPKRVASRIFLMSDKIVVGSSELGPRRNGHGRNVMSRWKLLAATTALAALLVAATVSLPVWARELQPLATAAPWRVRGAPRAHHHHAQKRDCRRQVAGGGGHGRPQGEDHLLGRPWLPRQGRKYAHEARFDLSHLLDDQTACLGGGDDAGRRRRHPAHRSRLQVPAGLQRHAGERGNHWCRWQDHLCECAGGEADHRAGSSAP